MRKANNNRKRKGEDNKEIVIVSVGQDEKINMYSSCYEVS